MQLEQLKEECEALRRKLKSLEERNKFKSTKVEEIIIDEPSPHDVRGTVSTCDVSARTDLNLKFLGRRRTTLNVTPYENFTCYFTCEKYVESKHFHR